MKLEIEQQSIGVTQDLSHDLLGIISRSGDKMTPFMKLFWEQQQKNIFLVQPEAEGTTPQLFAGAFL